MEEFDVIIIGGSVAGLTASIFCCRKKLKTLIVTKDIGGQAKHALQIENYPGFKKISGIELMKKFFDQAMNAGAKIFFDEIIEIKEKNGKFFVKGLKSSYVGKALILAFGKTSKKLNLKNEKKFFGRGISYCIVCDGPLFSNKVVAIFGDPKFALNSALCLSKIAKKVYLISEGKIPEIRNVERIENSKIKEIKGEEKLSSIVVENLKTKEVRELKIDGLFVELGYEFKTDFIKNFVKLDKNGQIVVNERCETFYPKGKKVRKGVFAAGDVTNLPKQIIIAAGSGAIAALQTYNYLNLSLQI